MGFALFGPDSLLSGVGAIDVGSKRKAVLAAGIVNGVGSLGAVLQEEIIGYLKAYHSLGAVFQLLIGVSVPGAVGTGVLWWWWAARAGAGSKRAGGSGGSTGASGSAGTTR